MLLEIISICAITAVHPFYDCSEQWTIYWYDTPDIKKYTTCDKKDLGNMILAGCTDPTNKILTIGSYHDQPDYVYHKHSVLYHELLHIRDGAWHG